MLHCRQAYGIRSTGAFWHSPKRHHPIFNATPIPKWQPEKVREAKRQLFPSPLLAGDAPARDDVRRPVESLSVPVPHRSSAAATPQRGATKTDGNLWRDPAFGCMEIWEEEARPGYLGSQINLAELNKSIN